MVRLDTGWIQPGAKIFLDGKSEQVPGHPMEKFLADYIARMRPLFPEISEPVAHKLASAFLSFRFGLYENAAREWSEAGSHIPGAGPAGTLKKAVSLLQAYAENLQNSQISEGKGDSFSGSERQYTAINLPADKIDDPGTLEIDNALVLVYTVSLMRSPDDEEALEEHRKFIVRMLNGYKKPLGFE